MRLFHGCHLPVQPGFDSGFDDIGGGVCLFSTLLRDVLPFLKTSGLIGFDLMYVNMKSPQ